MRFTHPSRLADRHATAPFDMYRDMVLHTFKSEFRAGFFIAYYRNFAIPSIAKTLVSKGETTARPMKRSYDTGIVIHEIIVNGFDSERGSAMVELLRRVHRGVPGSSEDFLYVLMTLLVIPVRWADRYAWRKLTDSERDASLAFYTELGSRMGLSEAPETFEDAAAFLDDYENRNMKASPEGAALMDATAEALAVTLPGPLKSKTRSVLGLMMDKPEVSAALGLKPANPVLKHGFDLLVRARGFLTRFKEVPSQPAFIPGTSGSAVYPNGYKLEDIGPS